jgi:hypothetical protein
MRRHLGALSVQTNRAIWNLEVKMKTGMDLEDETAGTEQVK